MGELVVGSRVLKFPTTSLRSSSRVELSVEDVDLDTVLGSKLGRGGDILVQLHVLKPPCVAQVGGHHVSVEPFKQLQHLGQVGGVHLAVPQLHQPRYGLCDGGQGPQRHDHQPSGQQQKLLGSVGPAGYVRPLRQEQAQQGPGAVGLGEGGEL